MPVERLVEPVAVDRVARDDLEHPAAPRRAAARRRAPSCPAACRRGISAAPTKPVAPVTRTFMTRSLA